MEDEKIKAKIEKLLKHQASAADIGNLEEAATFAAKAQDLMAKYNIENFELKEETAADSIDSELIILNDIHNWSKSHGKWMQNMYGAVSRANFCKIIISDRTAYPLDSEGHPDYTKRNYKAHRIYVLGDPMNIEMVRYIADSLISRLKYLQGKAWKEYQGHEKKGQFRRGYFEGAVAAIQEKLWEQQRHNKEQYTGMTGLIKLTDVAINEKISEQFGKLGKSRGGGSSSMGGRIKGQQDGSKLNINKGVGKGDGGASRRLT